jgi:sugar phosphate permease
MGEVIRAQYRGRAVGCVQSDWAIGGGIAVLLQAILFSLIPPEQAWRWQFASGALPALIVFFVRRFVEEPSVAAETRSRLRASGDVPAIWEIFSPPIVKTTLIASLFGTGVQGRYYAVTAWLPTYLQTERQLSIVGSTGYLAFLILGAFVGYLVGAWLADRVGRRTLFLTFAVCAILVVLAYTQLPISDRIMWLLGFPLGFFASGYISGVGPFLTELFPTRVRGSAQGFCYNFGRRLGAFFPTLIGYLSATVSLGRAIAIFAVIAYGLMFVGAVMLPDGMVLHAD